VPKLDAVSLLLLHNPLFQQQFIRSISGTRILPSCTIQAESPSESKQLLALFLLCRLNLLLWTSK